MAANLFDRFQQHLFHDAETGLQLDVSRMNFADDYFDRMAEPMARAFEAMDALEAGAIANPDEGRMVGHYWLRDPQMAPDAALTKAIERRWLAWVTSRAAGTNPEA